MLKRENKKPNMSKKISFQEWMADTTNIPVECELLEHSRIDDYTDGLRDCEKEVSKLGGRMSL